jgi:formamidopyrimidine-DNA glycosylase
VPEGDSVWRVARRLDRALSGRTVTSSDVRVPRYATADLSGRDVLATVPRGKHLLTRFSGGLTLHTHLRMDGEWAVVGAGKRLPGRLTPDIRILLRTGPEGPSAYGLRLPVVELLATADEAAAVGHLGPDLLGDWDPEETCRRLAERPDRPLAAALLDQRNSPGWATSGSTSSASSAATRPGPPSGRSTCRRCSIWRTGC